MLFPCDLGTRLDIARLVCLTLLHLQNKWQWVKQQRAQKLATVSHTVVGSIHM